MTTHPQPSSLDAEETVDLTKTILHDLRNCLQVTRSACRILHRQGADPSVVAAIEQQTDEMSELIRALSELL